MTSGESSAIRSIVLIDDDVDFLHIVQRRLQSQRLEYAPTGQVEIHTYTDPVEAFVNLPATGICVVILDNKMPGTTGVECIPRFVKAGLGPIVLLTNCNDAAIAAEAFRAGAVDFIAKTDVISDDKRLGRAIREAVNRYRLEERNTVLTRQLKVLNIELEAKNKCLNELSEKAHQFVDDVAHDFRTPLTVIQQYASIIADGLSGSVTESQRDQLGIISEATQDLSGMVDDFLDSSKLRAKAISINRQRHTVQELLDSIDPVLEVRAEPRQISVERAIAENVPSFFGDLSKVSRILTNLIVNAIKVTPRAGILQLWGRTTEAGDVCVGVTDQGPGMKPEDLKIIFDRFQQLNEPQVEDTKGFGLGLSIVKHLTWLNFGSIQVQSQLGKGSTFSFTLPAFNLKRILAGYLESVRLIDDANDFWMLHIREPNPSLTVSRLRRLVSSICYPMDLVLQDEDSRTVRALGMSRDAEAWANRLRKSISRFEGSVEAKEPIVLEIKSEGPWLHDADAAELSENLFRCLGTGSCYV